LQRVVQAAADPTSLLRPGLLDGLRVLVACGSPESRLAAAVAGRCEALAARVDRLELDPFGDEPVVEGEADVLVWDGAGAYAAFEGVAAVRAALDGAWLAIRPVARGATAGGAGGGKLLLIAPPSGDAHAEAARGGLENLARTLSIEWARFGVRVVALHPGAETLPADVAEVAAFLASRAGDYYSGCRFELGPPHNFPLDGPGRARGTKPAWEPDYFPHGRRNRSSGKKSGPHKDTHHRSDSPLYQLQFVSWLSGANGGR
jgi:hypothetical protein